MMFGMSIVKSVLALGVSVGSGATVKFLVAAVTPENVRPVTKIAMKVSSVVIGVAVGELAANYMENQIDSVLSLGKSVRTTVEKIQKQRKENDNS